LNFLSVNGDESTELNKNPKYFYLINEGCGFDHQKYISFDLLCLKTNNIFSLPLTTSPNNN